MALKSASGKNAHRAATNWVHSQGRRTTPAARTRKSAASLSQKQSSPSIPSSHGSPASVPEALKDMNAWPDLSSSCPRMSTTVSPEKMSEYEDSDGGKDYLSTWPSLTSYSPTPTRSSAGESTSSPTWSPWRLQPSSVPISRSPCPKKEEPTTKKSSSLDNHVFVANVPINATKEQLKKTFAKFGKVQELVVLERSGGDSDKPRFCFLVFSSGEAAKEAIKQSQILLHGTKNHKLRVERRKRESRQCDGITEQSRATLKLHDKDNNVWLDLMHTFNWQFAAARYLFRTLNMEDYLAHYIHILASYRQVQEEPISTLMHTMIQNSESCPKDDLMHLMPPSISGLVCNQTIAAKGRKRYFDVVSILERRPDLFTLSAGMADSSGDSDKTVKYRNQLSRSKALAELRNNLVEGLFIYFFAKFCHGRRFKIKVSYYQKSEPVRSVLMLVTGQSDIANALRMFFGIFNGVFVFDKDSSDLSLTLDYFSKEHREKLKPYLVSEDYTPQPNDDVFDQNDIGIVYKSEAEMLGYFLAPVEEAESKQLQRTTIEEEEEEDSNFCHTIQSVVDNVLLDDEALKLLTNPYAIDNVINKLEFQMGSLSIERSNFKRKVEEQTREIVARLIHDLQVDERNCERSRTSGGSRER